jgi:hypothetical protein
LTNSREGTTETFDATATPVDIIRGLDLDIKFPNDKFNMCILRLFAADAKAHGESLRERHFSEWLLPPDTEIDITPTHKGEHGIMRIQTIIMRTRTHSMQAPSNLLRGPHLSIPTPPQ